MGSENSKSLKYWANDEPGFMTGLFYSTKILLKTLKKGSVCKNLKRGSDDYEHMMIMIMSIHSS